VHPEITSVRQTAHPIADQTYPAPINFIPPRLERQITFAVEEYFMDNEEVKHFHNEYPPGL
jgi:hypothetical protein